MFEKMNRYKLLYTRSAICPANIFEEAQLRNCEIIHIPTIGFEEVGDVKLVDLADFNWIFFSSATTVQFFFKRNKLPSDIKIAAIGINTAMEIRKNGYEVDFIPVVFTSQGFFSEWLGLNLPPQNIIFPKSDISDTIIQDALRQQGHNVSVQVIYRTIFPEKGREMLRQYFTERNPIDIALFASVSSWYNFLEVFVPFSQEYSLLCLASIGPVTTKAIEMSGYSVSYQSEEATMKSLFDTVFNKLDQNG